MRIELESLEAPVRDVRRRSRRVLYFFWTFFAVLCTVKWLHDGRPVWSYIVTFLICSGAATIGIWMATPKARQESGGGRYHLPGER